MDTKAITPVLKQLRRELNGKVANPAFLIWGSYAVGTQTEWSDLDVIVVSNSFKKLSRDERSDLLDYACLGARPDLHAWAATPEELEEAPGGTYIGTARETGVWIDV